MSRNVVTSAVPDTLRASGPGLAVPVSSCGQSTAASTGLASPRSLSPASIQARPASGQPRAAPASDNKPHNCFLRPRSQPEPGDPLREFYSLTIPVSDSQSLLMSTYSCADTEATLYVTVCVLLLRHHIWALSGLSPPCLLLTGRLG